MTTITDAFRRGLVVVFCPRCQWKLVGAALALMEDPCPECKGIGLDAIEPRGAR